MHVSILIPVIGYKNIYKTLKSIQIQKEIKFEILILRNDIKSVSKDKSYIEKNGLDINLNCFIREIYIPKKGKGNALNVGIQKAKFDYICVLDADCILKEDAIYKAIVHFKDRDVYAVGGRLIVQIEDFSVLESIQYLEYQKTFLIYRNLFSKLNAQCLISGAFGIFKKDILLKMNGYDIHSVGEDMELILRLQEILYDQNKTHIVYELNSICLTQVPHSFIRLMHQRDRWQRGLLDCLIKHYKMIGNIRYGTLGLFTLSYQFLIECLGPVFWSFYLVIIFDNHIFYSLLFYLLYFLFQIGLTFYSAYLDADKNIKRINKWIPKLILITFEEILIQIPLIFSRIYGMITYHWRKMKW